MKDGKERKTKKSYNLAVIAILVIIVAAIAAYAALHQSQLPVSTSTTQNYTSTLLSTTIPAETPQVYILSSSSPSVLKVFNFLKTYNFSSKNMYPFELVGTNDGSTPGILPSCTGILSIKMYLSNNFSFNGPIDYSNLVKTTPISIYAYVVQFMNKTSLDNYTKGFYSNGGFCNAPVLSEIESNSTGNLTKIQINGSTVYFFRFYNLTPAAVNADVQQYSGSPPQNIDYFLMKTIYDNMSITVAEQGFPESMNTSKMSTIMSNILQYLKQNFG